MKRKEKNEWKEEYGENKDKNIEEKVFVILRFLKQSKNEKKTHGY